MLGLMSGIYFHLHLIGFPKTGEAIIIDKDFDNQLTCEYWKDDYVNKNPDIKFPFNTKCSRERHK